MKDSGILSKTHCSHCGEECIDGQLTLGDKNFCCEGCKMVFQILDKNGFCEYYNLNATPGISQRKPVAKTKFAFLEDEKIRQRLISYADESQTHVTFYLPQMHCSSCLYLLENVNRLNKAIVSCKVNFSRKEVSLVFNHKIAGLRVVAELLTSIGYEPYISLNDLKNHKPRVQKRLVYQLGIAGFCFANIMLLSFPEYLGLEISELFLSQVFRTINVVLAIPVFFYSALPFYQSGWSSLRHGHLNIDAPIAVAIIVTFARSLYEILSGSGAGYLDSMSGIVFFMLIGRYLQEKTYQHLSFERDFSSYFPIAVTVVKESGDVPAALPEIRPGDTLRIHNEELIPTDGIITRGSAFIDYSFVTGESIPVNKEMGEIVYAGGKQTGGVIEILVIKEVSQSYLTRLWSTDEFKRADDKKENSFVHILSRYFTYIVFSIAISAGLFWYYADPSKIWSSVTAVLIIACPCALLLSNTFTNGHILNILGRRKLYLRNAQVIEEIARTTHIVFDKTGTLSDTSKNDVVYHGRKLTEKQLLVISALASQSTHPLSRAIHNHIGKRNMPVVNCFKEIPGSGIEGFINTELVSLGSKQFVQSGNGSQSGSSVYVAIENEVLGFFTVKNHFRDGVVSLVASLSKSFRLSVISGDNNSGKKELTEIMGKRTTVLYDQKPEDKLAYIKELKESGEIVMMVGDGLNDAGALKQSNTGIAVTEDCNNFTPASDGILEAGSLGRLHHIIRLCVANRRIVIASFIISILYNISGLFFAVQGNLSPVIAAILMPASSISIMLFTFFASKLAARRV